MSGESVMQYWKQSSPSSELTITGVVESRGVNEVVSGAEYVAMALMWPLQQASRIELFEPPMGTAQEGRVVGGGGTELMGWQDISATLYISF